MKTFFQKREDRRDGLPGFDRHTSTYLLLRKNIGQNGIANNGNSALLGDLKHPGCQFAPPARDNDGSRYILWI